MNPEPRSGDVFVNKNKIMKINYLPNMKNISMLFFNSTILLILFVFTSCAVFKNTRNSSTNQSIFQKQINTVFTDEERKLIHSGSSDTPFRVLQITSKEDSLILRKQSVDLVEFASDTSFIHLVKRLKITMEAEQGVGIAAPQVGISRNLFLFVRVDREDWEVSLAVNPRILSYSDTTICFVRDGCLSIPDFRGNSVRYPLIEVEYQDVHGMFIREVFSGYTRPGNFTNIIFQHEYDHLRGVLFIDKLCAAPNQENLP
jgi:peptide deformylase